MGAPTQIDQLEKEFRSGKNPLAFIPLCRALRRGRRLREALEVCRQGLAAGADSVAARALHARLLNDLEDFQAALEEARAGLVRHPEAMGLLLEEARALMGAGQLEEAGEIIGLLEEKNPLDDQVQKLASHWRRLLALGQVRPSRSSQAVPTLEEGDSHSSPAVARLTREEIPGKVMEEMEGLAKVISCAVIPIRAGEPALSGDQGAAEAGYTFFKGACTSCEDLDVGTMRLGILETEGASLIVLVRQDVIVTFACEPTNQFGRVLFKLQGIINRYLAEPSGGPST